MKLFGHEVTGLPKALVFLAAVFLVASGLCGLQLLASNHASGDWPLFIPLGLIELAAMVISAVGIVVVLLIWIGSAIFASIANRGDADPKSLFDSSHDSEHDNPK
jgi:hypothetical protein